MSVATNDQAQGETYYFSGGLTTILVGGQQSGGTFSLHETTLPPGAATPPHVHDREDETVYVIAGALTIETGGVRVDLCAGHARLLPRHIPHRLSNEGEADARYVVFCTPAGFDDFVRKAGERAPDGTTAARPMTRAERVRLGEEMERHGIHFVEQSAL